MTDTPAEPRPEPASSDHGPDLRQLPMHDAKVDWDTRVSRVSDMFKRSHELPGVIVAGHDGALSVLSRAKFMECLSRPLGLDIFMSRPIRLMLKTTGLPTALLLPGDTPVHEAAHAALRREAESVYEPVVVVLDSQPHLLDVHDLLMAQSELLEGANETIQRQKTQAESANQAKSEFLANMSHEIRTPLTAILGFAENMLEGGLTEDERKAAIGTILRNGEHLLEIINDILDLSKIEAGKFDVERLTLSPTRLMADVMSVMRVRADAKKLDLRLTFEGSMPDTIQSDPTRLRQILINLLGNAIKFTEKGHVELRVSLRDPGSDHPRLVMAVVDTGIGMTGEQLARLFQPFQQADNSVQRRFGGTGLGLTISRRFANMLGGDIHVTTSPGGGSTFSLEIDTGSLAGVPMVHNPEDAVVNEPTLESADEVDIAGRILLVEDGRDNQLLIGALLRKHGAEVEIRANGLEAIETISAFAAAGNAFQVVLMDMHMPQLDGYEATRRLRASGCRIPIIALTAAAMDGDAKKCLDAGCDAYAAKPINRTRLLNQIAQYMAQGESHVTSASPPRMPDAQPAPATPSSPAASSPVAADKPIIDENAAMRNVDHDPELLLEIGDIFVSEIGDWATQIHTHADDGDQRTLTRLAHSLKSAADNLGAGRLRDAAQALEIAADRGDADAIQRFEPDVQEAVRITLPAVKEMLERVASAQPATD